MRPVRPGRTGTGHRSPTSRRWPAGSRRRSGTPRTATGRPARDWRRCPPRSHRGSTGTSCTIRSGRARSPGRHRLVPPGRPTARAGPTPPSPDRRRSSRGGGAASRPGRVRRCRDKPRPVPRSRRHRGRCETCRRGRNHRRIRGGQPRRRDPSRRPGRSPIRNAAHLDVPGAGRRGGRPGGRGSRPGPRGRRPCRARRPSRATRTGSRCGTSGRDPGRRPPRRRGRPNGSPRCGRPGWPPTTRCRCREAPWSPRPAPGRTPDRSLRGR